MNTQAKQEVAPIQFLTHPNQYKHMQLTIDGAIARICLKIDEDQGLRPGYKLKLNSYDLGVDIELADATTRLRFEHPEVKVVCIESGHESVFSAGANIFMLGLSSHSHKVNFCKFTNETRNNLEEATEKSGQYYIASLNGISSGGGYELPLACAEIHLIDDRKSSVSLPEVPYLGVLPGTGGLTRLVDKRKVRRDHADIFCTLAEGVKGQKAKDWKIVDEIHPSSTYDQEINARLDKLASTLPDVNGDQPKGIDWEEVKADVDGTTHTYRYITLQLNQEARTAQIHLKGPQESDIKEIDHIEEIKSSWYGIRFWRELNDALLQLRFNYEDIGVVSITSEGDIDTLLSFDEALHQNKDHWLIRETLLLQGRVLKMIDVTARSFYTLITPGSCFAGSFFEIALASDRIYMFDSDEKNFIALSSLNVSQFPMGHGLARLNNRFYEDDQTVSDILSKKGEKLDAQTALKLGLVTDIFDDIDWDDEIRIQIEERASLSPDALTGLEANIRFAGPETMETRIFGRLSAWQNWIFTRPNATGEHGALTSYGKETNAQFNWRRT